MVEDLQDNVDQITIVVNTVVLEEQLLQDMHLDQVDLKLEEPEVAAGMVAMDQLVPNMAVAVVLVML